MFISCDLLCGSTHLVPPPISGKRHQFQHNLAFIWIKSCHTNAMLHAIDMENEILIQFSDIWIDCERNWIGWNQCIVLGSDDFAESSSKRISHNWQLFKMPYTNTYYVEIEYISVAKLRYSVWMSPFSRWLRNRWNCRWRWPYYNILFDTTVEVISI